MKMTPLIDRDLTYPVMVRPSPDCGVGDFDAIDYEPRTLLVFIDSSGRVTSVYYNSRRSGSSRWVQVIYGSMTERTMKRIRHKAPGIRLDQGWLES